MRPRREEYYSSNADVFVPEAGMRANEFGHQTDAFRVAQNHQFDASGAKIRFGALKRLILADHDPGNLVEQRCAAAHVAGREGRVEGGAAVFAGFRSEERRVGKECRFAWARYREIREEQRS